MVVKQASFVVFSLFAVCTSIEWPWCLNLSVGHCLLVAGWRRDLNAARLCVDSVKKDAARDPYMLLTHANVVLAALPTERLNKITPADKESNKQFVLKVTLSAGLVPVVVHHCQLLGCLGSALRWSWGEYFNGVMQTWINCHMMWIALSGVLSSACTIENSC
jgi:hypothetical protein